MLNKSDYLRNANINQNLRGVAATVPSAWYIALFNVTPTSAGGGTEVTGPGYVRKAVTFAAPSTPGETSNTLSITQAPTGDWGDVVGAAVFDASTGGNMLYFGELGTPKTVYAGDDMYFPAGYFVIAET